MLYEEEHEYGKAISKEDQERAVRLSRLCTVYGQHDRIITGDAINVHVAPNGPAPAWSDGQEIFINADQVSMMDLESLVQVNGLNYHELCHQMFTPRRSSALVEWVIEKGYFAEFNILEDQRIETLMIGKYPSTIPYLTATVVRWLAADMESLMGNYVCVRGRRYLPLEIRTTFRDAFAFPHLIPAIADIVDKYRTLVFPKHFDEAKVLIQRFHDEVYSQMQQAGCGPSGKSPFNPTSFGGPNNCGRRNPTAKGRPIAGSEQERIQKVGQNFGTPEPAYTPPNGSSENGEGTNTNNVPGSTPQEQQHNATQQRNKNVTNEPSRTPGNGHVPSVGGVPDKVLDVIEKTLADVMARKDVQTDVKVKQKAIVGSHGRYRENLEDGRYSDSVVPNDAVVAYRRFAQELQRLRTECQPGWDLEMPSGRLNVQRVIRGCELDQSFDRWDEGNDGTDLEAVILVDRSGSMSYSENDRLASVASWVIKRAMESIDCPATIYSFDTEPELAYRGDEKVNKTQFRFIYGSGGTDPYEALINAERLLMSSTRKNKILIVITDGAFNTSRNDDIIERIGRKGILTAMCLIDRHSNMSEHDKQVARHKCEVFAQIDSAVELIPFAKGVVTGAIRKRMSRAF